MVVSYYNNAKDSHFSYLGHLERIVELRLLLEYQNILASLNVILAEGC
jgi:hypothetical protein